MASLSRKNRKASRTVHERRHSLQTCQSVIFNPLFRSESVVGFDLFGYFTSIFPLVMASYIDDHNLNVPSREKKSRPCRPVVNPDISHFMPSSSDHPSPDVQALASLFAQFRDSERVIADESHQVLLDDLISQLLEEGKNEPSPASKTFMENLDTVEFSEAKGQSCAICKDDFTSSASQGPYVRLPCRPQNHIFDKDCVLPWLQLHNTCPVCRYEVPSDDENWLRKKREEKLAAESVARAALEEEEEDERDSMYG